MTSDELFSRVLIDLEAMERITEAKIQATVARDAKTLVALLQEEIDPMYRLSSRTLELAMLSEAQRQELAGRLTRWGGREQHLKDLLENNLGYIEYLKQLMGINTTDPSSLNAGL